MASFLAAPLASFSVEAKLRYEGVPSSVGTGATLGSWRDLRLARVSHDNLSFFSPWSGFLRTTLAFLMLFQLIYLGKKYRTHKYSECFPEGLHLLASDSLAFLPHGAPCCPPAKAFLREVRKETQRRCMFQHSEFEPNERRAKALLTCHVLLYFSEPSWSRPGGVSVLCCCGLLGVGPGEEENRKILRESTGCDRKLSW